MFENSLMESAGKIKTNKTWKGLALIVELLTVGFLIALPLIYPEVLPARLTASVLLAPPPAPAPSRPATHAQAQPTKTTVPILDPELAPDTIPPEIPPASTQSAPPSGGGEGKSGDSGDSTIGVIGGGPVSDNPTPPPKADPTPTPAPTPTKPQKISSGVMEASLIHRIEPPYPPIARIAHVQGDVTFQAFISKQGMIENLRPIGAVHPILLQAALDAVKQWRYRPTLLNGEPIEVETTITIRFHI